MPHSLRILIYLSLACSLIGGDAAAQFVKPTWLYRVQQDKTHYEIDDIIKLEYQVVQGLGNEIDVDQLSNTQGLVGVVGDSWSFDRKPYINEVLREFAKPVSAPGNGEFSLPVSKIPFSRDFYRHLGFTNDKHFFIKRELVPPADLIRSDKSVYQIGESITFTVSDDLSFLKDEHWLFPDNNGRFRESPSIEVWFAPREVPGGATQLPQLAYSTSNTVLSPELEGFQYVVKHENYRNQANVIKSNHGFLPMGHYHVLLKIRDTIIGEVKGGFQIIGPERESITAMKLEPQLDEDEHDDQGVPVYDELPSLLIQDSLSDFYLNQGSVEIYRVGEHGELREVLSASRAAQWRGRSLLRSTKTGGYPLKPGLYEARFYFGGRDNPQNGQLLLQSLRFYLSKKSIDDSHKHGEAQPLASGLLSITADKAGPYHIGELVKLMLTHNKGHKAYSDDVATELAHSDLYLKLSRLGQYHANCAFIEEESITIQKIQTGKERPRGQTGNTFANALNQLQDSFVSYDDNKLSAGTINNSVHARYDRSTPRIDYQSNGQLTLNPPDVPGRYAIDVYRRSVDEAPMSPANKFIDAERLHRFVFEVEARRFPGLARASANQIQVPEVLSRSDTVIGSFSARLQLPGSVKTYLQGRRGYTSGVSIVDRYSNSNFYVGDVEPYHVANSDYRVYRAVLGQDYVLDESEPFLNYPEKNLEVWIGLRANTGIALPAEPPSRWPEDYLPTPISWQDLVTPLQAWLLPDEACYTEPLPDYEIRLVRLDGEHEVDDEQEWLKERYGSLDFDPLEYEELDDHYIGYPFFIEAKFDEVPPVERISANINVSGEQAEKVWLIRTEDDPTLYRSERAHYIGASAEQE